MSKLQVGDQVYWYKSLADNARPWPAEVLNIHDEGSLDLNVSQPNRVMFRQTVLHRTNKTLLRWNVGELEHQGAWETREEAAARKTPVSATEDTGGSKQPPVAPKSQNEHQNKKPQGAAA